MTKNHINRFFCVRPRTFQDAANALLLCVRDGISSISADYILQPLPGEIDG